MKILEMVGKKLEAELELFIMDCHALGEDQLCVGYTVIFNEYDL